MRLDSLVLIGQFAPLHNGHIALLRRALERADRVIVLIGSAGRARNSRHPWTAAERADMNRFLDELAAEARPPSGRELSQRALAMTGRMRSAEHDNGEDLDTRHVTQGNGVDPYSLELYFEALIRKALGAN